MISFCIIFYHFNKKNIMSNVISAIIVIKFENVSFHEYTREIYNGRPWANSVNLNSSQRLFTILAFFFFLHTFVMMQLLHKKIHVISFFSVLMLHPYFLLTLFSQPNWFYFSLILFAISNQLEKSSSLLPYYDHELSLELAVHWFGDTSFKVCFITN